MPPLEADPVAAPAGARAGGAGGRRFHLGHDGAVRGQEVAAAAQEADGVAADADVPVGQQDRAPPAGAGEGIEDRALQHRRPLVAGQGDGGRGRVDAERHRSPPGEAEHEPARAAADVEHGRGHSGQERLLAGGRFGVPPAGIEGQGGAVVGPQYDDGIGDQRHATTASSTSPRSSYARTAVRR